MSSIALREVAWLLERPWNWAFSMLLLREIRSIRRGCRMCQTEQLCKRFAPRAQFFFTRILHSVSGITSRTCWTSYTMQTPPRTAFRAPSVHKAFIFPLAASRACLGERVSQTFAPSQGLSLGYGRHPQGHGRSFCRPRCASSRSLCDRGSVMVRRCLAPGLFAEPQRLFRDGCVAEVLGTSPV